MNHLESQIETELEVTRVELLRLKDQLEYEQKQRELDRMAMTVASDSIRQLQATGRAYKALCGELVDVIDSMTPFGDINVEADRVLDKYFAMLGNEEDNE